MPYTYVTVALSSTQIKKLKSKSAKENGTSITLKPAQMNTGTHKLSLTESQKKRYDNAKRANKGVNIKFSKGAVNDMEKHGGFFPLLIPALTALATGVLSSAAGFGTKKLLEKVTGGAIKRKKRERDYIYREAGSQELTHNRNCETVYTDVKF